MWWDSDPPALVDTHALQTPVHPCDEFAQTHLTDEGFASIIAAQQEVENRATAHYTNLIPKKLGH